MSNSQVFRTNQCRQNTVHGHISLSTHHIPQTFTTLKCLNEYNNVWCHSSFLNKEEEKSWWRYQMETFSALLAICAGNSPVTGEFSAQMPVTQNFDVSFDLRLNKRLSKHSWGWWFETPSRSLWRHCHDVETLRQRRAYLLKFITQHKGWCWNSSHITWSNSITCLMMSILPSFSPIVLCWNWYSTEKSPCPRRAHRV